MSPSPTRQDGNGNGDLSPPPYTETEAILLPSSLVSSLTSPLTAHLQALPSRMRAAQHARSTQQAARELDQITLMVPHIEAFLASLAMMDSPTSPLAELTLVPAVAVPRDWTMSEADERRSEGVLVQVARVHCDLDVAATAKSSSQLPSDHDSGFASGADNMSWWKDETLARRLAAYLQPKASRTHVHAVVDKENRPRWGWGRKKTKEAESSSPTLSDERVSMTVWADEVTFRKENDFGVWESMSGFGIIVLVNMKRT